MKRVQEEMNRQGVEGFVIPPSSNLYYLTGCGLPGDERFLALLLPREGPSLLMANALYRAQVETLPVEHFLYWTDGEDPYQVLKDHLAWGAFRTIALEQDLRALFSVPLVQRVFPGANIVLGDRLTGQLRLHKDPEELALIRRGSEIAERVLSETIGRGGWRGKRELDFMEELCGALRRAGVVSYRAIVAVGENAAVPHHVSGETRIEEGSCLLVDFVGKYQGYCTDMTRTFHFGPPSEEFRKVYDIVLEAHRAGTAAAKPGNTLGDVDAAARGVIEQRGYGPFFIHRTGHGIGIDAHEGPSASPGEATPLEPGMIFSVEPGIYLPGRLGVRIENLVAILPQGREVMQHSPLELQVR
jgi:Xaa-Pro dipeptidase